MAKVEITARDILEAIGFDVEVFADQEVEIDCPKFGKYHEYKDFIQISHREFGTEQIEFKGYSEQADDACKRFIIDKLFKKEN